MPVSTTHGAHLPDLFAPNDEAVLLRQTVRRFVEQEVEPQALEYERNEKFNLPLFRKLGGLGLLGITVAEADGGAGMDAVAAVIAHEELSASDPGFALSYLAHSMLFVNNFYRNANAEQRARYLDKVVSGEWVAGMCMSEPGAGTDVLGMTSRARRDGDRYLLTGRKMWITNGCVNDRELGDLFLVYAKTGDALSTFVVPKGTPGFSLGQRIKDKAGMRSSPTAELVFEDCPVPVANRLGEEGDSVMHMMRNLEIERLTLAAMGLGIARRCVELMNRYAGERKAFQQPINSFGQIQRHIAESYTEYLAGRSMVYDIARRIDLAAPGHRMETDAAKLFTATMSKNVADRAIQVMGGFGYVGEAVVERLWRAAKLLEIGGGTIEAHHKNITRDLARNPAFFQ
ncbi:MAG: acyl-CoA dehydrogenase family protein [Candidatus Lambdaproteobacteria bacterium]|nr:acyl-CoA dehydrogenase family protein [Candidatus Lambdaproteobacteria bacterium]